MAERGINCKNGTTMSRREAGAIGSACAIRLVLIFRIKMSSETVKRHVNVNFVDLGVDLHRKCAIVLLNISLCGRERNSSVDSL